MQSMLIYILAFIAGLGLVGVHVHGFRRQRRALWLAVFFDLVVGGFALLALLDHSTFSAWMQEDAWVEWATFYAFAAAGLITALHAVCMQKGSGLSFFLLQARLLTWCCRSDYSTGNFPYCFEADRGWVFTLNPPVGWRWKMEQCEKAAPEYEAERRPRP